MLSHLKYLHLAYFSKPAGDRAIYRAIRKGNVHKILEIGIGTAARALRIIGQAQRKPSDEPVRFIAVDMFEARPKEGPPGLTLKEAHRLLKATSASVQLIPGDPASALARSANALQNMDLVIISTDQDESSMAAAWFYLPRMLHASSMVYLESRLPNAEAALRLVPHSEIETLANTNRRRRAA